MIKQIRGRAVYGKGVSNRVHVGAEAPGGLAVIVNIDVFVKYNDKLGKHHLAETPQGQGGFSRLPRVLFVNSDKDKVVKTTVNRQVNINNSGNEFLDDGQENSLRHFSESSVFHGGGTHNSCGIDGVFLPRHAGDVKNGEGLRRGVETRVVSKGALRSRRLFRVDIAFQDEIRLGRDGEFLGDARRDRDPLSSQDAGEGPFIHSFRKGSGRQVGEEGIPSQGDGDGLRNLQPLGAGRQEDVPFVPGRSQTHPRPQPPPGVPRVVHLDVIALGIGLALLIGWELWPLSPANATPASLRRDYKDDYIRLVAVAYQADGDLRKAQARLAALEAEAPQDPLVELTEYWIKQGKPDWMVLPMVRLARDLGVGTPVMQPYLNRGNP